jgi:hypothetical protein
MDYSGPPASELARITREIVERHDEWDAPHQFVTWQWDGERLTPVTVAIITPDIDPRDYYGVMYGMVEDQISGGVTPAAFLLQIEAYSVRQHADATGQEKAQLLADHRARALHERPDAVETCIALCADVHGRVWEAVKQRPGGVIRETAYEPGRCPGGHMMKGLLDVAYAAGMACQDLPGRQGLWN